MRVLILVVFLGIVGGVMLGLGRVMGEIMVVIMLIGNVNLIKVIFFVLVNIIVFLMVN